MGNIAQEPLKRISLIGNMFGHPMRLLVLRVVESRDGATWTQIKSAVEETYGPVNPNTLNFHLTKLVPIEAGQFSPINSSLQIQVLVKYPHFVKHCLSPLTVFVENVQLKTSVSKFLSTP